MKVEMARLQVAMMSVLRTRETNSEIEHLQCDPQQLQVKTFCFHLIIVTVYIVTACSFSDTVTERQRKAMDRGGG